MLILASKSPRRREILSKMGYTFEIKVSEANEDLPKDVHPKKGVEILAIRKGEAVLPLTCKDDCIVSGDTLVEIDGEALGKPTDADDAVRMLMRLSGKEHRVHTGVAVLYRGKIYSGSDTTSVFFKPYDINTAAEYVKTGEPMDKAGAYGIQGLGAALAERTEGDLDTVIGLSSKLTQKLLTEAGYAEK